MPFISSEIEPAPPFEPVRTRQGTVASLAEAEEALITTAARIQISHLHKTRPARADVKDRQLLASVLGQACGLTPEEMLRQAGIQVTATVQRELAMQAAADLGREHARTGHPAIRDRTGDGSAPGRCPAREGIRPAGR